MVGLREVLDCKESRSIAVLSALKLGLSLFAIMLLIVAGTLTRPASLCPLDLQILA
ncbi:hypothetical protein [Leisingera sp. ANG-S5]|uniref:hypothetical protein n=1 Tax=Leisingera sp. ANG-S5 TaxID=1577901 RepID=UPI000AB192B0|nr:hypothetical protein [Leisingera sp. ANG-S5]